MSIRLPLTRFQSHDRGGAAVAEPPTSFDRPAVAPPPQSAPPPAPESAPVVARPTPNRLLSLDAFRGLTILGMLLVNNISLGAQTPKEFLHAEWSGAVHMADLVFPWFLFIVGVAVPYAAASARRKHLPTLQFDLKALWRAGTLVFLGCVIDSFLNHRPVFDLGVLQIIGLAYFMAVLVGGLFSLRGRLVMAGMLLAAHWAILKFVPVPGVGAGVFTEEHNVVQWVNATYLSHYHLNGLLSVIPTTAMVLLGTAAGDLLRRKKIAPLAKAAVLAVCGGGLVSAGLIWSHTALAPWNLPMNKPVWTAPYILYTAGWACVGLAVMYLIVDVTPGKWGQRLALPLIVPGMNAIVAYVAPILTKVAILRNLTTVWPTGHPLNGEDALRAWCYGEWGRINGGWAFTFGYIAVWWCVLLFLYKKRWFLRV